jgi:type II secretory pathway component GspD/PulD (secretin)
VVEIRRVFTYSAGRVLALRGTPDELAAAAWMIQQLDQPSAAKHADADYKMVDPANRGETDVRILYTPYAETVQQFQEVATLVRTVAEIRRVFTYNAARGIAVRGTADQIALATWLAKELGKPADGLASALYSYPDDSREHATAVQVFYVKGAPTAAAFQQIATQIRTKTQIRRVFTYGGTNALAVRGTPDQVAAAEQMLKDRELAVAK